MPKISIFKLGLHVQHKYVKWVLYKHAEASLIVEIKRAKPGEREIKRVEPGEIKAKRAGDALRFVFLFSVFSPFPHCSKEERAQLVETR